MSAGHVGAPAILAALLALAVTPPVAAEGPERPVRRPLPHAGYVYPAGGQAGTTFRVDVGGQFLRGADTIRVSGGGVTARLVLWLPAPRPLDGEQRAALRERLAAARATILARAAGEGAQEAPKGPRDAVPPGDAPAKGTAPKATPPAKRAGVDALLRHPLLADLESKTLEDLQAIARYFFQRRNPLQRKRSIEETARLEVTIAPDAAPGLREVRLATRAGLSNPLRFCVGALPEVLEREPNHPAVPRAEAADLPVVFNGQILPQDADRFRFRAHAGQRLVLQAQARTLIPYQADSVPGWMQATLAVLDEDGRELAFADEYRFDPDPVLFFDVPRDGEYLLEVRDAIARGREDFVYRVTVGELPFVTQLFPLGGRAGEATLAHVEGRNLAADTVTLDTTGGEGVHAGHWSLGTTPGNEVAYAVDTLPEGLEREPNDEAAQAALVKLPVIVSGRIDRPGDVDHVRFAGRAGDDVVVEVRARVLGSPLDSAVRLLGSDGAVVAWNDDYPNRAAGLRGLGLQTHDADSFLRATLPADGLYVVRLSDSRGAGGPDHAYRLRVSAPRPDVELYVTPSSVTIPVGRATPIEVVAARRDGFDGPIDVALDGAPPGFVLHGATVPRGRDRVRMTLTAPRQFKGGPLPLRLVARFVRGETTIQRAAVPADDVMQAFLWRHLVPAEEFVVAVLGGGGRWLPRIEPAASEPLRLPAGGTATLRFRVVGRLPLGTLSFQPFEATGGLAVGSAHATADGFALEVRAPADATQDGLVENLVLEAITTRTLPDRRGGGKPQAQRVSAGVLPAVPFVIVAP